MNAGRGRDRFRRPLQWLLAPIVGAVAGLAYALMFDVEALHSAVRGVFIGTPILLYERGVILRRWRDIIRQAATPVFVVTTIATYVLIILIGNAAAGTALHHLIGYMSTAREAMVMSESGFLYSLGVSALVAFVFRLRDLIGPSLFTSLLLGRYHRPIKEERIFLFLDVSGSTHFAERYGDLETQAYLGQIFNALASPVRRSQGSIDDYIGDMALVTWPMDRGMRDAACLRCVFDFAAAIRDQAAAWQARFGQVPEFRAVLHCGSVVTAEIGLERHKIAYFGDVVNTTGRLESLSKALGQPILVSADILAGIRVLPPHLVAENLGFHVIRGRDEPLQISAVKLALGS
ncbi:MAG: adenylate/guanylate cyclase domain-containing protein [Mesorhizobium sp.]|nr:adenylate/guanylate cyclase domain-containing protein [Mesorhizobium sp.]RWM94374.1 MAG: adenylate/guanylate cyclase domain-containing protein [Mesorhizobium sp.]